MRYTNRMSIVDIVADKLESGGDLEIIADLRNPKRVLLKNDFDAANENNSSSV